MNKKKIILTSMIAITLTAGIGVSVSASETISDYQNISFDDLVAPKNNNLNLTRGILNDSGIVTDNWDNNLEEHSKVEKTKNNDNYLSIFTPEGGYGTKTSGAQVEIALNPGREYYMSYDMQFDKDYSWGGEYKGGKLPGLTAGARCSGVCDGTDGFAARFMWRREGEGELYLCYLDQTSEDNCDDYYFTNPDGTRFKFEKGKKYTIEEYVKLNSSPDAHDGIIQVWINGVQVLYLDDIRLVTDEDLIDTFYLSTFYGGNSEKWQATNDSYIYFDNIVLQKIS